MASLLKNFHLDYEANVRHAANTTTQEPSTQHTKRSAGCQLPKHKEKSEIEQQQQKQKLKEQKRNSKLRTTTGQQVSVCNITPFFRS